MGVHPFFPVGMGISISILIYCVVQAALFVPCNKDKQAETNIVAIMFAVFCFLAIQYYSFVLKADLIKW